MKRNVQNISVVIVDDEPLAIEGLKLRLDTIEGVTVIGEGRDGDDAMRLCQELQPDVLFIDLRLPGLNGLEVVQLIQADVMPLVVFVSAHSEYALDAFELNAIDYILKPANVGRLKKTIERVQDRLQPLQRGNDKFRLLKALEEASGLAISELEDWLENTNQQLPSKYRKQLVIKNRDNEKEFVPVRDIRWIDAAGDYMCIHTDQQNYIVRITMKKLESELDSAEFKRIHKSTLVNINCVKSIQTLRNNESMLSLGNDVRLKVSRNYSDAVKEIIDLKVS